MTNVGLQYSHCTKQQSSQTSALCIVDHTLCVCGWPCCLVSASSGAALSGTDEKLVSLCSGAGKTTVAALMSRFYAPDKGQMLLNGQSATSFTRGEWARAVSVVQQEPVLFGGEVLLPSNKRPAVVSHWPAVTRCMSSPAL